MAASPDALDSVNHLTEPRGDVLLPIPGERTELLHRLLLCLLRVGVRNDHLVELRHGHERRGVRQDAFVVVRIVAQVALGAPPEEEWVQAVLELSASRRP